MKIKALVFSVAIALSGASLAQDQQPIKILIGYAAGGNGDLIARILAQELRPLVGRNVIVENKPGANGRIAAFELKTSPADGSYYLFAPDSWAIFPTILNTEKQLRYNLKTDFTPVARIVSYPLGFFASSQVGAEGVKDYVQKLKANVSLSSYGSSASGGVSEFLGKVMSQEFGAEMQHVAFKGGSESRQNLLAGQISSAIMTPGDGLMESQGKIKPLGFFTSERWPLAPDVPTFKEQGFDIVNGGAFSAFWTSAATPAVEREKMQNALKEVLAKKEVQEKLAKIYAYADFAEGSVVGKEVDDLLAYWKPIVLSKQ